MNNSPICYKLVPATQEEVKDCPHVVFWPGGQGLKDSFDYRYSDQKLEFAINDLKGYVGVFNLRKLLGED